MDDMYCLGVVLVVFVLLILCFLFSIFGFVLPLRTWEELREGKEYDQNIVYEKCK